MSNHRLTPSARFTAATNTWPDYKETMEIGKDYREGEYDSKFANRWPDAAFPEFKTVSNEFFEKCHLLHLEIMRALALAMGLGEAFFDDKVDQKAHNLRLFVALSRCSSSFFFFGSVFSPTRANVVYSLNYPPIEREKIAGGGNRAGSHSE